MVIIKSINWESEDYVESFEYSVGKFPAGELNIEIGDSLTDTTDGIVSVSEDSEVMWIYIETTLNSSDSFIELMIAKSILDKRYINAKFRLDIDYLGYSQADKEFGKGVGIPSVVIGEFINSLGFYKVGIRDPHSDVSLTSIRNSGAEHFMSTWGYPTQFHNIDIIISPDAGAFKKTEKIREILEIKEIVVATKVRDLTTNEIVRTDILYGKDQSEGMFKGKNVFIFDDICLGGRTFTEIAKVINSDKQCKSLSLAVTHGVFNNGIDHIIDAGFDHIYTTDSVVNEKELCNNQNLTIVK